MAKEQTGKALTGHTVEETRVLAKKGGEARVANDKRLRELLMGTLGTEETMKKRQALLDKAMSGGELTNDQWKVISLLSSELEFHIGKRARVDEKGKTQKQNITVVNYGDKLTNPE